MPIEPIWLCPLRLPEGVEGDPPPWPLYPIRPERTYVNVGFWSVVPSTPGAEPGATNRLIEDKVSELGGHKSLYSDAFYTAEDFAAALRRRHLRALKERYDPNHDC